MTDRTELLSLADALEATIRAPDMVDNMLKAAAILRKMAEQTPVGYRWLNSAHFRVKMPANADRSTWNPVYAAPVPKMTGPKPTPSTLDGCTEDNCTRCRTPPALRGNMQHAGIGHYPDAPVPKEPT